MDIELARAREAADRFQEKLVLSHLAAVYAKMRDFGQAILTNEQALVLARQLGDARHEADILWQLAIQHAELGQRDLAISNGQTAINLMQNADNQKVAAYVEHLKKYRADDVNHRINASDAVVSNGPGILQMAVSAAKSLVDFVATGMKVAPNAIYQKRIEACQSCASHTGVRCKLCGCFTSVKARLPHEICPQGKWAKT